MRPDRGNISVVGATRVPDPEIGGRQKVYLYRLGEKVPGKDKYQHLCEECPFPDCIRVEGDFSPTGSWGDYPGCPVWEASQQKKVKG